MRDAAKSNLEKHPDRVDAMLRDAWERAGALETKRRLEALLTNVETVTPDRLRQMRALEALEQIATPEALRLLESLAVGDRTARLTREASETLARVRKR